MSGSLLLDELISEAGGCSSTVSEYLRNSTDPDGELQSLVSKHSPSNLSAETEMDSFIRPFSKHATGKIRLSLRGMVYS